MNTYVRMLFIDYSSAFNTIVPSKLITKLRTLLLNSSLCNWILDFLMGHPQVLKEMEMIVDFRKKEDEHDPILINGAVVEQVESLKFRGIHINKLT